MEPNLLMTPEPSSDLAFEDALGQLERIVDDLEQGEPELASALAKYEQAIRLLARCHGLIDGAERTIALLTGVDDQGQPVTTPFDATATVERETSAPSSRKVPPGSANSSDFPNSGDFDPPF
jgi:exodeoxyribonuclease VII small subunit